jgi:hypothetical protein
MLSLIRVRAVISCSLLVGACKTAPVNYPDDDKVAAAEKSWCAALAKYEAPEQQSWRHTAACNAGAPTGSAPFVAQMAECYRKHHQEHGENAQDLGGLVSNCADEILGRAEASDVSASEAVQARCARMERCEKVAKAECLAAFDKLDPMQKAGLTSMYSLRGQHEIAECLANTDCSNDEDSVRTKCYQETQRRRVWMPTL